MFFSALALSACSAGGEKGEQGPAGEKGISCSVKTNADGTGSIVCPDGTSFNIPKGEPGDAGSVHSIITFIVMVMEAAMMAKRA